MSRDILNSKSEKNLIKAFIGESMARNRYTYYAQKAQEEGYEQIAEIFLETADNEKTHAQRFFSFLGKCNLPVEIENITVPTGVSDTITNLNYAIEGEREENSELYPQFAQDARDEGFEEIAQCFDAIALVEVAHEKRYRKIKETLEQEKLFKKDFETLWKCRICGFSPFSDEAPAGCPACLNPQKYFQMNCENY